MKLSALTTCLLGAAALAACAPESQGPTTIDATALAAQSSGGTRTVYDVSVSGDFALPAGSAAPQVTRSSSDPFAGTDISLKDVSFRIGGVDSSRVVGPSGDAAVCAAWYPNADSTNSRSWPTGWNGNAGTWTGSATISEKSQIFNLRGTRTTAAGVESVQSSAGYAHDWQRADKIKTGDVWSLTFTNALQYFGGSGGTTRYDAKYRCVNFTITLTPAR